MKLSSSISAILAILPFANTAPAAIPTADQQFKLKSIVISGNKAFGDQYVSTYHTGAGLNTVVMTKNMTEAPIANVNGSSIYFTLAPGFVPPFGLAYATDTYARWGSTTASIAESGVTDGFAFNDTTGYLTNTNPNTLFKGWRVCRWTHGVPELFHNIDQAWADYIPHCCANVHLEAVYV